MSQQAPAGAGEGLPELALRRYLIRFDTRDLPLRWADVLVIGSGVAGLRAALEAAERGTVIIATKAGAEESNTRYAQGGIAAAIDASIDSWEKHAKDTIEVGGGLCGEDVVKTVCREGADDVRELIRWGAAFDRRADGELNFAQEGGHSVPRILHATGDATGLEVERVLLAKARANPRIRFLEHAFCLDLLTADGECQGALVWDHSQGLQVVVARATVLASGGAGRVYRETTNPAVATGDGLAAAFRAGAVLEDMEFIQFHPTTLYVAGAARALISEALRGEGARLLDRKGVRFMKDAHELAELAPRDVVARAIVKRMRETDDTQVYLDMTHLPAEAIRARFPGIDRLCRSYGLDLTRDKIPVRPSAHYTIGGVAVDMNGATTLPRLFAAGECSCTTLHGANRLGSNSLLEGLVFGRRAGAAASALAASTVGTVARLSIENRYDATNRTEIDIEDATSALRALMWREAAIERDGAGLARALERIRFWSSYVLPSVFAGPRGWELQNLLTVAWLVASRALVREESRGAHMRLDHPERDDRRFRVHSKVKAALEGERVLRLEAVA
ncbi:MAG TPA: L-aspartate oxidase [Planctomycetota bacterium]|nr:L-aspartate oxidase [Planctomycetota bacterium]